MTKADQEGNRPEGDFKDICTCDNIGYCRCEEQLDDVTSQFNFPALPSLEGICDEFERPRVGTQQLKIRRESN